VSLTVGCSIDVRRFKNPDSWGFAIMHYTIIAQGPYNEEAQQLRLAGG